MEIFLITKNNWRYKTMKNIFKKYYEMTDSTKEMLGELYMINELEIYYQNMKILIYQV